MGELTEVNTVPNDWVDFNQEITFALAVSAHHGLVVILLLVVLITISIEFAGFITFPSEPLHSLGLSISWGSIEHLSVLFHKLFNQVLILNNGWVLLESELAVLAEDLVASFAFQWHVGELFTHGAADFIDQFLLKFILNLIKFNVNRWNWLWAHDLLNGFLWNNEIKTPLSNVLCLPLVLLWHQWLNWSCCQHLLLNVGSSWTNVSHAHSHWGAISPH